MYVLDGLQSSYILECTADELNSNWIRFFIDDVDVNAGYSSIIEHSQCLNCTIRERRSDPSIVSFIPIIQFNCEATQLSWGGVSYSMEILDILDPAAGSSRI